MLDLSFLYSFSKNQLTLLKTTPQPSNYEPQPESSEADDHQPRSPGYTVHRLRKHGHRIDRRRSGLGSVQEVIKESVGRCPPTVGQERSREEMH